LPLVLAVILDRVVDVTGVDAASILLMSPELRLLEYAAGKGFRTDRIKDTRVRPGEGLLGTAARSRRRVVVPSVAETELPVTRKGLFAAEELVGYVALPLMARGQLEGVLEVFTRRRIEPDDARVDFLESLAKQAATAIDNARMFAELQRSNAEMRLAYDAAIEAWARALDMRYKEAEGHTQRVTDLTIRLAHEMGLSASRREHLRRGALLHDIGKVAVPEAILMKPGPLTEDEWQIVRKHPEHAHQILAPIQFLLPALDIPFCHHEHWDGTGYPRGLRGDQIPLSARLFAVVNVWDTLCSGRPYRLAWPPERVREHIRERAGTQFDPTVVEAFLTMMDAEQDE
jgi:response regulator RpfG family c-di-GMP phosphodiesterase